MSIYKIAYRVCQNFNESGFAFTIDERPSDVAGVQFLIEFDANPDTSIKIWEGHRTNTYNVRCRTTDDNISDLWKDLGLRVEMETAPPYVGVDELYVGGMSTPINGGDIDELVTFCLDVADYVG